MPRNGRWSNSSNQKSHSDLVKRKSIMAPSKGNDFFKPSSWFSRTRVGGENRHERARTQTRTRRTYQAFVQSSVRSWKSPHWHHLSLSLLYPQSLTVTEETAASLFELNRLTYPQLGRTSYRRIAREKMNRGCSDIDLLLRKWGWALWSNNVKHRGIFFHRTICGAC